MLFKVVALCKKFGLTLNGNAFFLIKKKHNISYVVLCSKLSHYVIRFGWVSPFGLTFSNFDTLPVVLSPEYLAEQPLLSARNPRLLG
jgi:hypothetical protein